MAATSSTFTDADLDALLANPATLQIQSLKNREVTGLRVLVRLDLDLPPQGKTFDWTRLEDALPTLDFLKRNHAKHVTVIAHRGDGASLEPIAEELYQRVKTSSAWKSADEEALHAWLDIRENLRLDPGEKANDADFSELMAQDHDLYVMEAFATAHRSHASIIGIPQLLPTVLGLQFEKELEKASYFLLAPKRPFVAVMGGAKFETKLPYVTAMAAKANVVLLGGKLALEATVQGFRHPRVIVAKLTEDTLDISDHSIEQFERFIADAKSLMWNGPMGRWEDGKHDKGTRAIAAAIARSHAAAARLIGGGDTEAALTSFGPPAEGTWPFISSGGGSLLHLLATGSLPALDAIRSSPKNC